MHANGVRHPKNYKPCNLMSTLPHIVVEWLDWISTYEALFVNIGQISPSVFFLFFAITLIPRQVGKGILKSYICETNHT
ncbi:hypothetical protein FEM48_Zijuj04G0100700 [Ziziphus jujuba var. spinosa]|uniref:Uncharacterized protein n=1 Tax=Ziziphus jujuba var. spinosa TaxID=714518 RepID=A0A978VJ90_ZIZJJ|nr:hypothetical protein FEM48_Zijuj04G0100700 [Ziziphus jujuba var. spinosa]